MRFEQQRWTGLSVVHCALVRGRTAAAREKKTALVKLPSIVLVCLYVLQTAVDESGGYILSYSAATVI